nr:DUF4276 family protein [uncultured Tolumonas sp.]
MSNYIEVMAIVEGKTEQVFVEKVLKPYLADKMIFIKATQASKPGQKGGDVKFSRVINDIRDHLKQRNDTYVTTLVDYYGIKEWPGLDSLAQNLTPYQIADHLNAATKQQVVSEFANQQAERRFIPYIAVHEFEALLFSDSAILASELCVDEDQVKNVLTECGEPEAINNGKETAPSKRLDNWSPNGKFAKTTAGIAIAQQIGITQMREQCPLFNAWLAQFEALVE